MRTVFAFLLLIAAVPLFADTTLTVHEQHVLALLGCKAKNYRIQNGRIIFGVMAARAAKRFYLIKNISGHPLWIDFPEGHIGATAWIGFTLPPDSWTAYVSVPQTGYLPAMIKGKTVISRLRWTCATSPKGPSLCGRYLYVCTTTRYPVAEIANPLLMDTLVILNKTKRSWWATLGPGSHTIAEVIKRWKKHLGYATN